MLQYLSMFELPHGNAAFGERRLPELAPLGLINFNDSENVYGKKNRQLHRRRSPNAALP
jgi:hypothetical protein